MELNIKIAFNNKSYTNLQDKSENNKVTFTGKFYFRRI